MSSGMSGAIRGGMAYVQAFLDDNPVTQGLSKLRGKLIGWQATLGSIGAKAYGGELPGPLGAIMKFATSPAGMFTGLMAAAKTAGTAAADMSRFSQVTGVGVEKLSALSYAAKQSDVSTETLVAGLRRLEQMNFRAASSAGKAGGVLQSAFKGLGVGPGADAADKLRALVGMFEKLDTQSRIGLAKKMGVSDLLPIINQGVAGLDALTARAKQLGLVMGEDTAAAGEKWESAWKDLQAVSGSALKAIGGTLVPVITGLTNMVVQVTVAVRNWIKEHRELFQGLFFGAGALLGLGVAFKLASIAVGIFGGIVSFTKGLLTAFNIVLAATEFLLVALTNPWFLIGAAILGVVGYLAYASGAFDGLGKAWKEFSAETSSSIKAIFNAIAKGNLQEAWAVVCAYFRLEWLKVTSWFSEKWDSVVTAIAGAMLRGVAVMRNGWNDLLTWVWNKWEQLKNWGAKTWIDMKETVGAMTPEEAASARQAADRETRETLTAGNREAERARKQREWELQESLKNLRTDHSAKIRAAEEELRKRKEALREAQDVANVPGAAGPELPKGDKAFGGATASAVAGTFSGTVAGMLGGGVSPVVQAIRESTSRLDELIQNGLTQAEALKELAAAGGVGN